MSEKKYAKHMLPVLIMMVPPVPGATQTINQRLESCNIDVVVYGR